MNIYLNNLKMKNSNFVNNKQTNKLEKYDNLKDRLINNNHSEKK